MTWLEAARASAWLLLVWAFAVGDTVAEVAPGVDWPVREVTS